MGFVARWGTSDVWYVHWDDVHDPVAVYSSDFDAVLVDLGFRDPASTGVSGTTADNLARALVIRRTLGHLSTYYWQHVRRNGGAERTPNLVRQAFRTDDRQHAASGQLRGAPHRSCTTPSVFATAIPVQPSRTRLARPQQHAHRAQLRRLGRPVAGRVRQPTAPSVPERVRERDREQPGHTGGCRRARGAPDGGTPHRNARELAIFRAADDFARVLAARARARGGPQPRAGSRAPRARREATSCPPH